MTSRAARHQYVREPRKVWVAMIASARRAASQADGTAYGQSASDADPKVDLAARLRAPPRFPVADASAGLASEAFLKIASAFVTAGLPERRQRFAGALAAMATTLDDLLADETAAQQRGAYYLGLD